MEVKDMGMTVETVNMLQDEMNKIPPEETAEEITAREAAEKTAADAKIKADADAKVIVDADAKKKEEEEAEKARIAAGGKPKTDEEEVNEARELREQLRVSTEALRKLAGDYERLNKIMLDKGLITEEEAKADKDKAAEAEALLQARQEKLNEMVAVMEVNPSYADVRQVCTQANFDDVIDAFARFYVKENGGKLQEVASNMEAEIFAEPNPYKKMYELVKKYHPKFTVVVDDKKKADEEAAKKVAADKKKKEDDDALKGKTKEQIAQETAANIGAGGTGGSGGAWTAAKIDGMDEEELKTVPKDIYNRYMLGLLK
jgi:membrane protein involved in colicin uptake